MTERGKMMGVRVDPVTLQPIECAEADHYIKCDICGGMIDRRDLAILFEHTGPLPHPAEDGVQ